MDNSNEMEYNAKVMNFMAMTETGDPEVATKYLQSSNWDETVAVNKFFSRIKVNNNNNNNIIKDDINNQNNSLNSNLINNNSSNNSNNNNQENEGFIYRYILGPLKSLLSSCVEKRDVDKEEEERIFHLMPNKIQNSTRFCREIRRRIGIIIFYRVENVEFLNTFINSLSRNTPLISLLRQYFCCFPLLANTNEGITMLNVVSENELNYPAFVFCFNASNNQTGDYIDDIFERYHIIDILQGEFVSLENFNNILISCCEKVGIQYNNNLGNLTDAEVLEQQNLNMEELEKQVQNKEEELKREKLLEQERKLEEEKKLKEIENKANEAKRKVVEEPGVDEPEVTTICFRYPDGEKRKDRRFLKSHTIQNLYDYVTSLGKEIYTEEENNSFSLYQPFPPKKYEEMENTLEKEGLFPNAIIQIREE